MLWSDTRIGIGGFLRWFLSSYPPGTVRHGTTTIGLGPNDIVSQEVSVLRLPVGRSLSVHA